MKYKRLIFTLIVFSGNSILAQSFKYPGKFDYYFSAVYNYRPGLKNNNFQGIKSGFYLTNFFGTCIELGLEKHTNKIDEFEIEDKVSGKYAKIGLELYTNIFKPRPHFRITYGFDFGLSQNNASRTYKYTGSIFGDRYETINYDYNLIIQDFHFGLIYVKKGIRVTSKLMFGDNATMFQNKPYQIYSIAGCPNTASFEFSLGYQIIKTKSKPFKSIMTKFYKIIF